MIGGAKKWLFALIGKPLPENSQVQDGNVQKNPLQNQEPQEDSVDGDIKMFKSFVNKGVGMVKTYLTPFAKKGTESVTNTTFAVKSSVDNKFIKIAVRSFIIIFFLIILIFVALYLFGRLKKEVEIVSPDNPVETPTPASFNPYKPSVYADDPEILILDEEINLLEGDIRGETIRESGINPPSLDYNISF